MDFKDQMVVVLGLAKSGMASVELLVTQGYIVGEERVGLNRVLDAAALTYVAALAQALSTLLYYVFLLTGSRRRN